MKKVFISSLIVAAFFLVARQHDSFGKSADLAGSWYSASPEVLRAELTKYFDDAKTEPINGAIIGAVAPHAGLAYSGPVAAYTYKTIAEKKPSKIIIVGFSHRRFYPGKAAIFTEAEFITPLGTAKINKELTAKLMTHGDILQDMPQVFAGENSVELQVPFAQFALPEAELVLIAMVDQKQETCEKLAKVISSALKDEKNYVILASSDMSHYLNYNLATMMDEKTIQAIAEFSPDNFYKEGAKKIPSDALCGYGAVYAVMEASKALGADKAQIIKYANSGDVPAGSKESVVGYMSAVFVKTGVAVPVNAVAKEEEGMFDLTQKKELLKIARETIANFLKTGRKLEVETSDPELNAEMGAFVTLHENGELRGCIGNMVARGPLYLTVRDMAIEAATGDPRFSPVTPSELSNIDLEISVLTPMKRITDYNQIEIGKHGVMVRQGWRSGVYLPQVGTETGWDREEFMNSLCGQKAGIPQNAWKDGSCEIYTFTAEVFGEKELEKQGI